MHGGFGGFRVLRVIFGFRGLEFWLRVLWQLLDVGLRALKRHYKKK